MKKTQTLAHEMSPDTHHDPYSKTVFGFWVFLMSDFILFGTLFATYAVLNGGTYGGPSAGELFSLPFNLAQTLVLLLCSFVSGLAGAAAHRRRRNWTLALFGLTFVLGALFLGMMLTEFSGLIAAGHAWHQSAFLSAYFTLVGTHGVHLLFGLLWIPVLLIPVWKEGIGHATLRRLTCLRMFWQFLNIVWIFIFSFVYLMGAI
jgi:cytochrome o ubiquinol oxidase subunit III